MVTGFLFDTLPALVRESWCVSLLRRFGQWLLGLLALAEDSWCFSQLRRCWHWLRRLSFSSALGRALQDHGREEGLYANSLFCRLVDRFFAGCIWLVGKIVDILTFGTWDSLVVSWARRGLGRVGLWDYPTFCGVVMAVMFLCPGQYWYNVYGLLLALVLVGVLAIRMAMGLCPNLRLRDLGLPFAAFVFAAVAGVGVSSDFKEGLRVFTFFLTSFLFAVALICAIRDRASLKRVLACLYVAMILTGLIGFIQRAMGVEVDPRLTDLSLNAGMPGRVFSTFENPNNYAEYLVLMLPLGFAYCTMITDSKKRAWGFLGLILPVGALLMTYSRSCWVSIALVVVAFLFLHHKKLLPWLPLAALLAIPLLPDSIFNRILTIGSTQDTSNAYRLYIWDSVARMVGDYGLTGIGLGPGNFEPVYQLYTYTQASTAPHSHMLYLEIWIEMGALGIGAFLVYYLGTIRKSVIALKRADRPVRMTLIAGASALIGIAFVSAAEYIWFYPRVMFTFFIVMGVLTAAINLTRSEEPA